MNENIEDLFERAISEVIMMKVRKPVIRKVKEILPKNSKENSLLKRYQN